MGRSKKFSQSSISKSGGSNRERPSQSAISTLRRGHLPKKSCRDLFSLLEPQINSEGIHVWPFDVSCPVDVLFLTDDGRRCVGQSLSLWIFRGSLRVFRLGGLSLSRIESFRLMRETWRLSVARCTTASSAGHPRLQSLRSSSSWQPRFVANRAATAQSI